MEGCDLGIKRYRKLILNHNTPAIHKQHDNMYAKLIILSFALAAASATYLGAPLAAAPIVAAPVAKAYGGYGLGYGAGYGYGGLGYGAGYGYGLGHYGYPLATSYANTYKVSKSVPVVKTIAAPVVASPYGYDLGLGYGAYGYGNGLAYGHGIY